jgi:hypothetical protein
MYYAVVYTHTHTFITTVVLFSFNSFDSFLLFDFPFHLCHRERKTKQLFWRLWNLTWGLEGGVWRCIFHAKLGLKQKWCDVRLRWMVYVGLRPYGTARESFWLTAIISFVQFFSLIQNPIVLREYSREMRPETLSVDYWENETFRGRWTGLTV